MYLLQIKRKINVLHLHHDTLIVDGSSQRGVGEDNETDNTYYPSRTVVLKFCQLQNKNIFLEVTLRIAKRREIANC